MAITGPITAGAAAVASSAKSQTGLADDFDSFLLLLTTQLKNQDPLSPMDANQFTQQLVQFTGVEQAIRTNDALGQLLSLVRTDQVARSVDYLGAEVEAPGGVVRLGGTGTAQVNYRLDQAASDVVISIFDPADRLVATRQGVGDAGVQSVLWDGRDQSGTALPQGLYRIEIAAQDAAGAPVAVETTVRGLVDGVEIAGDEILLSVEGVLLPLDSITAIRRPPASA